MATTPREAQLLARAYSAGITDPTELANFMAQVGHESNGLARLEEGFRYTKGAWQISANVRSALREGPQALESARLDALQGHPERLAELMYGRRMGNDQPGDGYRYRGRGYMQLTGKDQYRAAGEALGLDLVRNPELAAEPGNAARIATWYWNQNVPLATRDSAREAGAAINGRDPPNGLADRVTRFVHWKDQLSPEVMQHLRQGQSLHANPAPGIASPASLRQGDASDGVRQLQHRLNELGIRDAHGRALHEDGHFGPATVQAVRSLQHARGLDNDGIVGNRTRQALAKDAHDHHRPTASAVDDPLYQAIRQRLPTPYSNEAAALIAAHARHAGIDDPAKVREVLVQDQTAFVVGTTPGFRARVDLQHDAPPPSPSPTHPHPEAALEQERQRVSLGAR